MLIDCPECSRSVSDRAAACPDCAFPIAEHRAESLAAETLTKERASRKRAGATDCVRCEARGFWTETFKDADGNSKEGFAWCSQCAHTGRVVLCESLRGFWAVSEADVEAFLAGEIDEKSDHANYLGEEPPEGRYDHVAEDGAESSG